MSAALDAVRLAEGIIELRKEYEALKRENEQLYRVIKELHMQHLSNTFAAAYNAHSAHSAHTAHITQGVDHYA